jgi:hypothetical protein
MENPTTWTEAEQIVSDALIEAENTPPHICGLSLPRQITDALRAAGLLREGE